MESTAASDVTEGPVLCVINRRIRALRKKLNRISQMEDSLAKGKTLNKEQEETLRSKPDILAGIKELEKIRQPLTAAVEEEIALSIQRPKATSETPVDAAGDADCKDEGDKAAESDADDKAGSEGFPVIEDLLSVLYFGSMFDVATLQNHTQVMYSKALERGSCLSYDCMKDDDSADLLEEKDLDLISMLSGLLISRPVTSSLPHKHALERCIDHAKLWLENSDQPIEPNSDITYAGLRSKLNKILASQYLSAAPVMNYGTYQVPVQESIPPVNEQVQAEDAEVQYQQKEESISSHENEANDSNPVEEFHQEEEDISGLIAEAEAVHPEEGVEDPKDMQEQHVSRGSYHNYRGSRGGGGRRGNFNGRGGRGRGGTYQNGHNQYNDHPGNYRSRNSNYRGRGGRGGRGGGGGGYYNNQGYGGQAGNYNADS
ncbi:PREDICTED: uncharacterized protein LOC109160964 [Ipomoea nil]|uniref:uncharacterized protein LOC109160964 n=1 Tax=Ipomoea nil TaxID=35883 RepID=UPI000901CF2E|nr:PREDICTED: uncharacterized protein LOC109160964 [Ipomoea nil]